MSSRTVWLLGPVYAGSVQQILIWGTNYVLYRLTWIAVVDDCRANTIIVNFIEVSSFRELCCGYPMCVQKYVCRDVLRMHEQTKILKIRKVPAGEITISQSVLRLLHGDLMMYRSFLSIDWYLCIEYFVYRDYLGSTYIVLDKVFYRACSGGTVQSIQK